ncbi:isochorismatase [Rhodococcus sp. RS1C4]|nr:isochorismatase [Rhodococcus sp. RS1C4]OZC50831.1 isochorismatase [Rhodococcus sp. 06-621-2]OZC84389.1 isochorismatase [Rhodococcus sp. 06-418-1B]OZD11118.1 isochorismatase [Rhodococcus sp. 06-156-4C]OZD14534.1 isochorismatase [Rhodococcus sp. 06-156-4a]OZD24868.1 isochorismatase [Rhodococcus sp. 06-156-3C]OZD27842.1 isochorismatase [Rhodococcus sp. 06-156-3b]OZD39824.1 isochorismatase [Rhodococcus sp. 06-156-3]OZE80036.1 isochorismatase [Rhodococcus sp. 15-649-1-2]OZF52519.1 isochorism
MTMTAPRRALIVVDVQQEYFDGVLKIQYPPREESLANIASAIEVAASQDIPVAIVQHEMPEGSPAFVKGTPTWELHPRIAALVQPTFERVEKKFSSVFEGTSVAEWLTANRIDTITIVGYMTNNCDLATAAGAEALDVSAEILSDATGAINLANEAGTVSAEDLHSTLMVLYQSNFAAVASTSDWIEAVKSGSSLTANNLVVSAAQGNDTFGGE